MPPILSIQNISKSYGPIQALKNVSFDVPEGSVYGILGPNGSGKTTMLGIILDVLLANEGSFIWLGGTSNEDARKQIGSLLETPNFYHYLSAFNNLEISAAIKKNGLSLPISKLQSFISCLNKTNKNRMPWAWIGCKFRVKLTTEKPRMIWESYYFYQIAVCRTTRNTQTGIFQCRY